MLIELKINGKERKLEIAPGEVLLDVLRRAGYNGVKEGCREGECGSCVVLVNGEAVNSCLLLAAKAIGRNITTIEGLGTIDAPHPLQQAFVNNGAVQCGYCTPGIILSTKALLDKNPAPTDEEIRIALDGHLCRCTGYVKILQAVRQTLGTK